MSSYSYDYSDDESWDKKQELRKARKEQKRLRKLKRKKELGELRKKSWGKLF